MKLKPCPFCGENAIILGFDNNYYAACINPNCEIIIGTINKDTKAEAVKVWNTRAEEPERVAHWNINCDGYYPYCSRCKSEPPGREMSKYCPNCGAKMITRE